MSTLDLYDNDKINCYIINYKNYIQGLLDFSTKILKNLIPEDMYSFIFHCSSILQIQKKVYNITSIDDIISFLLLYKNIIIDYRDSLLTIKNVDNKFIVINDKQTPPIIWEKIYNIVNPIKCVSFRRKENIKKIKVSYSTWDIEDEYTVSEYGYYYQHKKIFQINDKQMDGKIDYPINLNDLITIQDNIILPEKNLKEFITILVACIFNNMNITNIYLESSNIFVFHQ